MSNHIVVESGIGKLCIVEKEGFITHVLLPGEEIPADSHEFETPLLRKAATEIEEYLSGSRKSFDLPLAPKGTPFQLAVWNQLLQIPYGETRSYKEIAEAIGSAKACRAVGMANNRNSISLIIPCHRVIGADGGLVGYGGGLEIKKILLGIEKQSR